MEYINEFHKTWIEQTRQSIAFWNKQPASLEEKKQQQERLNLQKAIREGKQKNWSHSLTPMDFVRNIRLKYACALLAEGKLNVSEVAYSVGFSDPQYFAKCFKEAFKETPSQFQRKNHVTH